MTNKVIKFKGPKKKDIISKLKLKYPRANIDFEHIEIPYEECESIPDEWLSEGNLVKLLKIFPHKDYAQVINKDLNDFIGRYLEHVLFKILNELYGFPPDLLTGVINFNEKRGIPNPHEWSYLILGPEETYFEIMASFKYVRPRFILWKKSDLKEMQKALPKEIIDSIMEFFSLINSLIDHYDNEYSLKNEKTGRPAISNLYFTHISTAENFIEFAQEIEYDIDSKIKNFFDEGYYYEGGDDDYDEAKSMMSKTNSLFIASIINSLLAVEGFINTLYEVLLLKQYKHEIYKKRAIQADIDLRILQFPLYCMGFTKANIDPDEDIFIKLKELRKFRNDLLHANVTEENKITSIIDNGFIFFYDILKHRKEMKKKKLHTAHRNIDEEDAKYVIELAKGIIQKIIGWMDEKEQKWVKSWINKEFIFDYIFT